MVPTGPAYLIQDLKHKLYSHELAVGPALDVELAAQLLHRCGTNAQLLCRGHDGKVVELHRVDQGWDVGFRV